MIMRLTHQILYQAFYMIRFAIEFYLDDVWSWQLAEYFDLHIVLTSFHVISSSGDVLSQWSLFLIKPHNKGMQLQNIKCEAIKLTMTCILDKKSSCACTTKEGDERSATKRHILLKWRQGWKAHLLANLYKSANS